MSAHETGRNTIAVYGVVPHKQSISRNTFAVYWSGTTMSVYFLMIVDER